METRKSNFIKGNKALATYLDVSDVTICKWKRLGKLNFIQIGATIFYDPDNLFKEYKRKRK